MQLHSLGAMADGCPAPDSPDDMILGGLVPVVGGAIVHSPLFHQVSQEARPFLAEMSAPSLPPPLTDPQSQPSSI